MKRVAASKEERNLRKRLKALVAETESHLRFIDAEMKNPSTREREWKIARSCNFLEIEKDRARFFGLDIDFRTGKKRKAIKP